MTCIEGSTVVRLAGGMRPWAALRLLAESGMVVQHTLGAVKLDARPGEPHPAGGATSSRPGPGGHAARRQHGWPTLRVAGDDTKARQERQTCVSLAIVSAAGCRIRPMDTALKHTLQEVAVQLELDEVRGVASLPTRARGLRQARAAGHAAAERQALVDLAATCVALAARIPAPHVALAEIESRVHPARSRSSRRRAA